MENLNEIKLSSDDILKKQFRSKVKGYDPDEVDSYLDQVISDYETFQSIIEDLYGQIGNLQRELMEAKKNHAPQSNNNEEKEDVRTYTPSSTRRTQIKTEQAPFEAANTSTGEISTNMAIIQRISTLERKVYNLEKQVYGLQK